MAATISAPFAGYMSSEPGHGRITGTDRDAMPSAGARWNDSSSDTDKTHPIFRIHDPTSGPSGSNETALRSSGDERMRSPSAS